ncbi:hypothetical protein TrispH2_010277 [Trichoplax sp. H2]|uniref:N-acetyltransferase domain-containing protein n=1 Tax=Trichoplax adhaerens TaxID=10228 RepID=B3SBD1_TRIAD|nr:predicted protein [Trichoplax adhaerens]EDV19983.1 predicted protein [Trichoplax adhaerens]RDD37328.1 hypothetical protein TrispH2_010277 [Trichoplax sp. H2]|eukprot:XP_002117573.1 predicted protein [Trichoplax adhaerens]
MSYHNNVQWCLSLGKKFHQDNLTEIFDSKNNIKYRLIKPWDIEKAADICAQCYAENNRMFQVLDITKEDYLPTAIEVFKTALEEGIGLISTTNEGKIVGAGAAYLLSSALFDLGLDLEKIYGKKIAPIVDVSHTLFKNFPPKKYGKYNQIYYIDDVCVSSGYHGKGIGIMNSLILQSLIQRRGINQVCSISYHPAMARSVSQMQMWKTVSILDIRDYTYQNKKIFSQLYEEGYREISLVLSNFTSSKL